MFISAISLPSTPMSPPASVSARRSVTRLSVEPFFLRPNILELPTTEDDKQTNAVGDVAGMAASLALERLVHPVLPRHLTARAIRDRVDPASTVLMTCGNPVSTADIKSTAARRQIQFEQEEW